MKPSPFPLDLLPPVLGNLIAQGAAAIDCDQSMIALPVLSACSAAIGNQRFLELKDGWNVPSNIWTLVVAPTGNAKSGAFDLALKPLVEWQTRAFTKANDERKNWKPDHGPEPKAERILLEVATEEAALNIAAGSPRALLVQVDEAGSWFEHGAYRDAKASANRFWLKSWDVGPYTSDTLKRGTTHVPRLNVAVTGAIQPRGFREQLADDRIDRGELARMLVVQVSAHAPRVNTKTVTVATRESYARLMRDLLRLGGNLTDPDRLGAPLPVGLDDDGWGPFAAAGDRWAERLEDMPSEANAERALLAKVKVHCARIALVLRVVDQVSADEPIGTVDAATMARAISLTDWLLEQTLAAYEDAGLTPAQRRDHALVEWIKAQQSAGTKVTVRHAARHYPPFRSSKWPTPSSVAQGELDRLADAGWLQRKQVNGGQGGKPSVAYVFEEQPEPQPIV